MTFIEILEKQTLLEHILWFLFWTSIVVFGIWGINYHKKLKNWGEIVFIVILTILNTFAMVAHASGIIIMI